jgi:hypothetical protein
MNVMALAVLVGFAFYLVYLNQPVLAGIVLIIAVVYIFSSTDANRAQRKEYRTDAPVPVSGPGAEEKVGTAVGKSVNAAGSFFGAIIRMIIVGPKHGETAEPKKEDSGSGRGPGGAKRVSQTIEY